MPPAMSDTFIWPLFVPGTILRIASDRGVVEVCLESRLETGLQKSLHVVLAVFLGIVTELTQRLDDDRAEAARRLGWHQNSFRRRCNELGLD
jgi:hypothetical protein